MFENKIGGQTPPILLDFTRYFPNNLGIQLLA